MNKISHISVDAIIDIMLSDIQLLNISFDNNMFRVNREYYGKVMALYSLIRAAGYNLEFKSSYKDELISIDYLSIDGESISI